MCLWDIRGLYGNHAVQSEMSRGGTLTGFQPITELQEVSIHGVRIKEEEVPMEVDAICDAALDQPITMEVTLPSRLFAIKMEDTGHRGNKMEEQRRNGAKMVDQHLNGLTREDTCSPGGRQPRPPSHFQLRVKTEAPAGTKMNDQLLYKPKPAGQPLPAASRAATVGQHPPGAHMEAGLHPGANMVEHVLCGPQSEEQLCSGPRAEDQYASGAKMADQYLRAILWQDMTVNLASTLLHQLSGNTHTHTHRCDHRASGHHTNVTCVSFITARCE